MNIIPSDKFDEAAIANLKNAKDGEVLKNNEDLLEWLQDRNWPVFDGVIERLSSLGDQLENSIHKILSGTDSIWKANIIEHLIPKFSQSAQLIYDEALSNLLRNPSEGDLEEGVVDFIEIQLLRNEENT